MRMNFTVFFVSYITVCHLTAQNNLSVQIANKNVAIVGRTHCVEVVSQNINRNGVAQRAVVIIVHQISDIACNNICVA